MSAKRNLRDGGKPSEVETLPGLNEKGGLGEIVFRGNRLQPLVVNPRVQHANRRRIAGENLGSKGINLVDGYFHCCFLSVRRTLDIRESELSAIQ